MYDAIVLGARVAGSSTAMLLARRGLRVLVVDRAEFPSDTLSTHQVQVPGGACLRRWGLLDRVVATGAPPARRVRFDQGPVVLEGSYPEHEGVDAVYSPRRTVLDAILVEAAVEAGADVRQGFVVEGLVVDDGRVAGIRGAAKGGGPVLVERAPIVIGADGKHSMVAAAVGAAEYERRPVLSMGCYSYLEGVPVAGGEIYGRGRRAMGLWPTNDGLTLAFAAWPIEEFGEFRSDVEGNFLATFDLAGDAGERLRAGRRVERFRTSPDQPNCFRVPHGPGWALVGDAGLVMDPVTGQGIGHALRQAELLSDAVAEGLGVGRLDRALARFRRVRDRETRPMYEFTLDVASFSGSPEESELLFGAIARNQSQVDRFLGVLTGSVPIGAFFSPRNLIRLLGFRGFAKLARARRATRGPAPAGVPVAA